MQKNQIKNIGFTIVELLVVIVIIGILAAITIVSYTGISQKATISSLQSDLTSSSQQLKLFQVDNSSYPNSITDCPTPSAGNMCLKVSNGNSYSYGVNNTSNPQTFCITTTNGNLSYMITPQSTPVAGGCPNYNGLVLFLDAAVSASYPGTGATWADLSGNNSNGTLSSAIYTNTNGGAISFGGAGDSVNIPYAAQFNIRNAITLSIWIKRTTGFSQTQDTMILGRPPSWFFYDAYNSGNIHGDVYIDTVRRGALETSVPFDNNWYQVVYTYDGNTHISNIYKNGTLINSNTLTGLSNYLIDSSTANFQSMGWNSLGRGMLLNDALIYNRALSLTEIQQNFNVLKNRYGL